MTDFLHGPEVLEIQTGARPIRTVRSAVIGLVGSAGRGPVNVPTLIAGNRVRGAQVFGGTGTIPDALEAIFKQHGAAVIVVNVLNPATMAHVTAVAAAQYQLAGDSVALAHRDVSAVVVTSAAAIPGNLYTLNADYTVDLATGVITRVATGDIPTPTSELYVTYTDSNADDITVNNQALVAGVLNLGAANITNVVVRAASSVVTYVADTDYTVDAAAGTVTRIAAGAIAANQALLVAYDRPNPAGVTATDIEGEVDATTGAYSGVSALLAAKSTLGHTPKVLIAPGYSATKSVADALISVANRLRAATPIEGPSATDAAAQTYRDGFGSRRAFLVDPDVQEADGDAVVSAPNSAYVAGVIAQSDAERGFWWSPSNRVILGIVGTARPIDFELGDPNARANLLNENDVATIIREDGYRLWGNRTCSDDPKWAFLSVVRTADILSDSLLRSHLWAIDRNITRTYFEDVANGVNAYIAELVGLGALIGGRCYPTPELNTVDTLAAGRSYFDIDFTPPPPAERLTFRMRLTNDYLEEIIS